MTPCDPIDLGGGVTGHLCSRGRRLKVRQCIACGRSGADIQCDHPKPAKMRRSKTCDAWLCRGCAVEVGPDKHHCPTHPTSPAAPYEPELPGVE